MHGRLSLLLLCVPAALHAQELVPNPGFEVVSSCPTFASMLDSAPPWYNPTQGTPELYHACAGSPAYAGVPSNISGGFQYARTGNGFAGLFTFRDASPEMREYIQVPLLEPMVAGRAYRFTMYVNQPNDVEFATDGIGARFSMGAISANNATVLPYAAHIENPSGTIITDTLGWTPITGCYMATGGEDHLTIGNFRNDAGTNSTSVFPGAWYAGCGYLLIDDVSVVPMEGPELGTDTTLCAGNELELVAGPAGASFLWQDGSTDASFTVTGPGTYWVRSQLGACVLTDTIHVGPQGSSMPELGPDRDLCTGEIIILSALTAPDEIATWEDGSTGMTHEVDAPGIYWVRIEGSCGTGSDTVQVTEGDCTDLVLLPNAFTPNGDDINDVFAPVFDARMLTLQYTVFDRWGGIVFHAPSGEAWDAAEVPDGIYAVRWESELRHGPHEGRSGLTHVTLLR